MRSGPVIHGSERRKKVPFMTLPTDETLGIRAEAAMRTVGLTLVVTVMNATMFNVALPRIAEEFGLTSSDASWIVTAYIIVYAIATVFYGKLADRISLKNLLTVGLLVFASGSVAGLLAQSFGMILGARVLQAAGGSAVTAASMIVPVRYFSPEARGRAMGVTATGVALGTAAGPIVSGLVTSAGHWRYLFLLSLLVLPALPFFRRYLDDRKGTGGKTDLAGGLLLGGAVAALLLAATRTSWPPLAAGAVLFALLALRVRFAEEPFLRPELFANGRFSIALLLSGLSSLAIFSLPFLLPQLLGTVHALTPLQVGFAMFPAAAIAALLGRRGGRIADERGIGRLFFTACLLFASGFALLAWASGWSPVGIALALIVGSVGQTYTQIALSHIVSGTLTSEQTGVGMGLYSLTGFIAGAVSTAGMGRALDFASAEGRYGIFGGGAAGVYEGLFVGLAALVLLTSILYAAFASATFRAAQSSRRKSGLS